VLSIRRKEAAEMNRFTATLCATCLALTLLATPEESLGKTGDDPGTELVNEKLRAELVFATTSPPHGPTDTKGRAGASIPLGESGRALGGVGFPGSLAPGLCMSLTSSDPAGGAEEHLGKARHLWFAELEALRADMRDMTLAVEWVRYDASEGGDTRRAKGDRRVITLEEGQRHLLDFVDYEPESDWYCGRNAAVYVEVGVEEDPALADERIAYELWLVVEEPDGERITRRAHATARQGERSELDLPSVRWPLPGAQFADGSPAEVLGQFDTSVRGRVRPDGKIAVDLRAGRFLSVVPEGERRRGGIGDGGRRVVRVAPGEAVELVLPETMGASTMFVEGTGDREVSRRLDALRSDPPADWDGYAAEDGHVLTHFPSFFEGTKMSLILKASRGG
jgi:hypothetical protein